MNLFPWVTAPESTPGLNNDLNYKEYEVDPETGQTTGHMLSGIDAVKAWAFRVLETQRLRYPVYTWDFGSDLQSFIGRNYSNALAESEIQRTIREALVVHPSITDVTSFDFDFCGSTLHINCKIVTIWGDTDFGLYAENI